MLVGYKAIADNYQKAIDEGENSGHHIDDDFAINPSNSRCLINNKNLCIQNLLQSTEF